VKIPYKKSIIFGVIIACSFLISPIYNVMAEAEQPHFDVAAVLNSEGLERLHACDFSSAELLFADAVNKNPGVKHYHNNLAVSLMRQGKYEEAIGPLEKAISIDPEYAKALSNMAIVCFRLSRYREAYGYYKLSRSADREYTQSRFSRDRVGREIDRLREEDPGNSVYKMMHNRLGKASGEKDWTMDEDPAPVKP